MSNHNITKIPYYSADILERHAENIKEFRVWLKKAPAYISSSFLAIGSEYFSIFFVDLTPKSDKNPDLTVKNSSLYKLELTITFPKNLNINTWCLYE